MPVDERLSGVSAPPTVAEQREQRKTQVWKLERLFLANLGREIEADELERVCGPNYRSRLCEMSIKVKNLSRHVVLADGRKLKLRGAYVYRPEQLGRDASEYRTQQELW